MATTATKQQSQSSPSSSSSKAASVGGTGTGIGGASTPSSLLRGGYAVKVSSASPKSPSAIDSLDNTSSSATFRSTFQQRQQHNFHSLTSNDTDDDIESIAKQISDHAEAIYQTWKARGLAPTEILNCHSVNSDAFDKTLTPTLQSNYRRRSGSGATDATDATDLTINRKSNAVICDDVVDHINATSKSTTNTTTQHIVRTADANMSNNNLKKLVSSFVNEDKARQQTVAARKTNILTSGTIKDALRKFESADCTAANIKPNYLKFNTTSSTTTKSNNSNNSGAFVAQSKSEPPKSQQPQQQQQQSPPAVITASSHNSFETKLSKNVPDVLIDTIEQDKRSSTTTATPSKRTTAATAKTAPAPVTTTATSTTTTTATATATATTTTTSTSTATSVTSKAEEKPAKAIKTKPETPAKPASLLNHTPAWPLKTRQKPTENGTSTVAPATKIAKPIANGENSAEPSPSSAKTTSSATSAAKATASENDRAASASGKSIKASNLMDEVQMEEERLINALKTGTVLNNDKILPEVITSTLGNNTNNTSSNNGSSSTTKSWNGDQAKSVTVTATAVFSEPSDTDGIQLKLSKPRPKNDAAVPHPDVSLHTSKTGAGAAARAGSTVPAVRPFLTRGSVAERVLMFEKCPEIKALRNAPKDPSKLATKPQTKPNNQTCTTLQRTVRGSKNVYIPRFHFPHGKPLPTIAVETTLQRLQAAFDAFPNNAVPKENFLIILKICAMPFYWRMPLFHCTQLTSAGLVDGKRFCDFWKQMSVFCHDTISRFVFILSRGQRSRQYILPEDLVGLVQDVVDTHPGLAFLKEAAEFHSRYVHTVIARIFYAVNRSWSGKITMAELRRSDLLQVLQLLEEEEDINQIMAYFSYEHFYVIYCKFWELDRDHDLFIDQNDLARHNDHALSTRIIERIFSGCVTKSNKTNNQKMSYTEFVWFLLSEEDKSHPTAVEYWFRCMDLDGDGILSMYELEYFYEEQQHRMESIGIETLPFEDCLCQMLDMIKPNIPGCITLGDLKRCKMTPIFYDTFFNLEKYMEHEQRDPFATQRDQDDMTDWDRYAAQEYELLVAEEGGDTHGSYDDDEEYESNIDILESHMEDQMTCGINDL